MILLDIFANFFIFAMPTNTGFPLRKVERNDCVQKVMKQNLLVKRFAELDLSDPFFDSLKGDYSEFPQWFARKAADDESAIVFIVDGGLQGFLYRKLEVGELEDCNPVLPNKRRYKIGTFKIDAHGTKLGERFLKKMLDLAISRKVEEVYVTVFPKHAALLKLFQEYGFRKAATKSSPNGEEDVLVKVIGEPSENILHRYPYIQAVGVRKWLLAIKPEFHTSLFPDSILKNETYDQVRDVSFTNSIHKVYVSYLEGLDQIRPGDLVLIYRTSDTAGQARFRSVVTSLCTVEEIKFKRDFSGRAMYISYCERYSVFDPESLIDWWEKFPALKFTVIKLCYNAAFSRRITRGDLIEKVGLDESVRWGILQLTDEQFSAVCVMGGIQDLILNQ